jgi:hypothetical protein
MWVSNLQSAYLQNAKEKAMKKIYLLLFILNLSLMINAQGLSVTLHPDGLSVPETTDLNGYVPIEFTSHAQQEFNISLNRIKDGTEVETFVETSKAVIATFGEDSTADPRPAIADFLAVGELNGGVLAKPGETVKGYFKLEPGTYVIDASSNESGDDYFYSVLTVTEGETLEAPEAALNLVMVDHHFSFPATLKAGAQRWQVSNTGEQVHFAVLFKLAEGATAEDLMSFMASGPENASGPPPFDMETSYTGIIQAVSSGQDYYMDVNLPAGNYVAICFLPDMESEKIHLELGMMSSFTAE